jgi:hypothetical protein
MMVAHDRRRKLILAAGARRSIRHAHLLPARVVRDEHGRVRIVLRRHRVPTLSEALASGALDVRPALRVLYGVASAADALSQAGLVARDLTPDRILVCPERGGLLADTGIPLELVPRSTGPDGPDLAYRSPEELEGLPIDARSNVYSLGAVFLAAVTAPDGERLALPAPVEAVVRRAMAIEPEKRYASATEFVVTLASAFGLRRYAGKAERRPKAVPRALEPLAPPKAPPEADAPPRTLRPPEPIAPDAGREPARDQGEARLAPVGSAPSGETPGPSRPPARRARPKRQRVSASPRRMARPRLRHPAIPRVWLPAMPRVRVPAMPRVRLPAVPRVRVPAMPRLRAPALSRMRVPALPALPAFSLPAVSLPRAPGRPGPVAVGLGAAVVACLLAGIVLARGLGTDTPSTQVGSSAFAIELPAGWGKTKVARTGGIELSAPIAAAPFGEGGAGLVVGQVSDLVPLDRRFRAEGERREVRLGRLSAWRYSGLSPKEGLAATAYLAPTTGAPLLVICHARQHDARTRLPECEDIASTIALRGERPASLARVSRHAQRLASVMARLRSARLDGRRRLAAVELAESQARAARDLEQAYRDAASRLQQAGRTDGSAALDSLVGSLRATAGAYAQLAEAAADVDEDDFRAASEAVVQAEETVEDEAAETAAA